MHFPLSLLYELFTLVCTIMYVQFIKTSVTRLYFKKVQKEIIYNVFSFPDFDWQLFIFLFENFNGVLEKTKQKQRSRSQIVML